LITQGYAFIDPDTTKRFEYKLSFKGPNLVFKDGTVPFWEHSGSTICTNDQIRITPSIRSQKGRIWSKATMSSDNWEIEVTMRVNGRGRVGADGMAIWYTETIGTEGPVFGSNDHWKGLGIFLDSFDNDAQQNNPYILIMTNDGTKSYDHNRDGITQQLGGCLRDFRNKPFPIGLKIEYNKRVLTVYYHNGLSENDNQYQEICARVENVDLPKNGHFGISAATGGLADDHDVLTFNTFSLIHNQNNQVICFLFCFLAEKYKLTKQKFHYLKPQVPNPEQLKYDQEYQEFLKQLELEKASYKKAHPEEQEQVIDARQNFESEYDRQFRTILDIQHSIHSKLHSLDSKFAEVLGRQERIVSLLTNQAVQMPGSGSNNNNNNNNQPGVPVDTFNRMEVNQVMSQQNELVRSLRDLQ